MTNIAEMQRSMFANNVQQIFISTSDTDGQTIGTDDTREYYYFQKGKLSNPNKRSNCEI